MDYAAVYGRLHENSKRFPGFTLQYYVDDLRDLIIQTSPRRLLDYGSGKGYQYLAMRLHEQFDGPLPHCYDPGVRQIAERPKGKFDGIICTDVMEHIEEADVDAVLADIFSFVQAGFHWEDSESAFAFFAISCRPANKVFEDGRNLHVTIKPPQWWDEKIARHARDGLIIRTRFEGAEYHGAV